LPTICEDVEKSPEESKSKLKPVIAVAAMGETPMSPVTKELGTVAIPLFARIVKLQAAPRSIGEGPVGLLLGEELGTSLGAFSPSTVGDRLGKELGMLLGEPLGIVDGTPLGEPLGVKLGSALGEWLGAALGPELGAALGIALGPVLGATLGPALGVELGVPLGPALG
jgi:hypothetical protein